jgi:hypothetical protein
VLGGRHPVGVDGLDVPGVRLALPAGHESCCDRWAFIDHSLRDGGLINAARGLRDVGQRHHRCPGQLLAGGGFVGVEQGLVPPDGGQHRQARLHIDAHVTGVDRQRERLGGRQTAAELTVDQQRPHVAEGDLLVYQVLNVDAAVAQRAAVFIRFGNFGGERDHTL